MQVFTSKRFISTLVMLLVMVLVAFVPQLSGLESELNEWGVAVILALIAGYTVTDVAAQWLKDNREAVIELTADVLHHKISVPYRGTTVTFDIPDDLEAGAAEAIVSAVESALALAGKKPAPNQ